VARITLTIPLIRAASTDAGNRWMRDHPDQRPDGTAVWTMDAYLAAVGEFHRLCRLAGIDQHGPLPR